MTSMAIILQPGDTITVTAATGPTGPTAPTGPTGPTVPPDVTVLNATYTGYQRFDNVPPPFAVKFTPTIVSTRNGRISGAEYGSGPSPRRFKLSSIPGDYGSGQASNSFTVYFTVAATENLSGYVPQLQIGKTYYMNVENDPSVPSGGAMFADFTPAK